ncbi:MAG TPA: sulfotransferase [Candidatus Sulfotelmatobacter sp.]
MLDTTADKQRNTAPVFVLGCPRSGTTLLYDMLLSAGGFAVYLAESNVFNVLALRFGDLRTTSNREKLLRVWLGSKLFRASGLDAKCIEKKILEECRHAGDFLQIVMDEIALKQGMRRWAENSPESVLHLPLIKKLIPRALVIHIIRDGRAVAMSLEKLRYVRPFPWQQRQSLMSAGAYWEWIVQRGRRYGSLLGPDYMEIRFEDLIVAPQQTLNHVGSFIDHELDYGRILQVAYGSVARPNTSFRTETAGESFNPVSRWQKSFPPNQLPRFETMLGNTLKQLGYARMSPAEGDRPGAELKFTRLAYRSYFEGKLRFKQNSLIRMFRPALTSREVDDTVLAEDHPPEVRSVLSQHS